MAKGDLSLDLSGFEKALETLDSGLALGLERGGAYTLEEATANVQRMEAIDTGALQNSGFLETPDHDGRAEAHDAARAATEGKQRGELEFADPAPPPESGEVVVGFGMAYAGLVHDGFLAPRREGMKIVRDRKSGKGARRFDGRISTVVEGRPFLGDAMDTVAGELEQIVGAAVKESLNE
ncbi:hypothetical protein EON81_04250 [bacterium]|nr:MAG: hypothetical protein EON81_04250 [bacterium]